MENNLFINLKIISKLKPKQRLSTLDELLYIEEDSNIPTLWLTRMYYGDSRHKTIKRINILLEHCKQYCIFNNENIELLQKMYKHLNSTIIGLKNLKKTYKKDITIISQLDNAIDCINSILTNNSHANYILTEDESESE